MNKVRILLTACAVSACSPSDAPHPLSAPSGDDRAQEAVQGHIPDLTPAPDRAAAERDRAQEAVQGHIPDLTPAPDRAAAERDRVLAEQEARRYAAELYVASGMKSGLDEADLVRKIAASIEKDISDDGI